MADLLAECVHRFGESPRRLAIWNRSYFHVPKPDWLKGIPDDKLMTIFRYLPALFSQGIVVWGHVIQANSMMFEPGSHDCPGELVYSLDRRRIIDPTLLQQIAFELGQLKRTQPQDDELAVIADYLTNERIRVFGLPVPRPVSPSMPCHISTTLFVRKHLPEERLCKTLLPIVVMPDEPHIAMPLPARYWPKELLQWWRT